MQHNNNEDIKVNFRKDERTHKDCITILRECTVERRAIVTLLLLGGGGKGEGEIRVGEHTYWGYIYNKKIRFPYQ